MPPVVGEDPLLSAAFREPRRHFRFDDDGITDERWSSAYNHHDDEVMRIHGAGGDE